MAISAEDVRNALFGQAPRLKPGYDMEEVDDFLDRVAQSLDELQSTPPPNPSPRVDSREVAELRHRVRELESQLARQALSAPPMQNGSAPREAQTSNGAGITADAVNLLSQAQASADQTIAEADRYAHELVTNARRQFEEILTNARAAAMRSGLGIGDAPTQGKGGPPPEPEPVVAPEPRANIEYVRSCAEQAQEQLLALLGSLSAETSVTAEGSDAPANAHGHAHAH